MCIIVCNSVCCQMISPIVIRAVRCCVQQFLCRKNVKSFLNSCKSVFGMKDRDLFEPTDLVGTEGFGKVRQFHPVERSKVKS